MYTEGEGIALGPPTQLDLVLKVKGEVNKEETG